ncbi:MAG: ABC transporter ATP-binding protein [Promethearchaeota archaeon]|nr:MAG: ABC transporter ATP-binding protein [Candidatus Lokiarchaeota archaeon]
MIQFEDVYLSFDNGVVFNNLSFSIKTGKNACIAGPSGSGKSSALKIIQGYLVPRQGKVLVKGLPLNKKKVKEIRTKIAYVPQNINLPVANGKELTNLIGYSTNFEVIENYLKQLGLPEDMFLRSFDQMSGGQKQRIIIAVCLSLKREILLLDEPTSSLDDKSIDKLIAVINDLNNVTVVSASHNPKWIKAMDQVIYL